MFLGFTEISDFQGGGFTESKTSIKEKNGQKRGLRQNGGGGGAWERRGGGAFGGGGGGGAWKRGGWGSF